MTPWLFFLYGAAFAGGLACVLAVIVFFLCAWSYLVAGSNKRGE